MLLTAVFVLLGLYALLWAVTGIAQAYVYQQPADRLPARAAVAALVVGGYIVFWVALDRKHPGKYDDFLAFAGYSTTTFDEFDAVRWEADPATQWKDFKKDAAGKPAELVSHYKRSGGKTSAFVDEKSGKPFALTGDNKITAAIVLKPDTAAPSTRFDSEFDNDRGRKTYPKESGRRRFLEADGTRYVSHAQPGVLYVPSAVTVFLAILVNLGMFAAWFVAFWPVLRFGAGFATLMTLAFAVFTIFVVMPVLFKPGRAARPAEEAVAIQSALRTQHAAHLG